MVYENEFFREVTLRICSSLDLKVALQRVYNYLKEVVPLYGISMGLYDPDMKVGRVIAMVSDRTDAAGEGDFRIPENLRGRMNELWGEKKPIAIINDIEQQEPAYRQLISLIWKKTDISIVSMNLELESQRIGAVSFVASGKNRYMDEHARLLSMLHEPFAMAMANILKHREIIRLKDMLEDDNQYLHQALFQLSGDKIIGERSGLRNVMDMVRQVAPLHSPVLLTGETGVGKEVIANALHYLSPRKDGPFIRVNCGAIPETLIDSELFGHEKGAFTGAVSTQRGRFERAHKGTIFLDEIGELPQGVQVRLLRVLQNKEIERVGGSETIKVDVRIISATNRNMECMIDEGLFRLDLWFRMNVFPIAIPPLRHRKEDIPELIHYFIRRKTDELKMGHLPMLGPGAMDRLASYHWPGNVRELENAVERELIQARGRNKGTRLMFHVSPPDRKSFPVKKDHGTDHTESFQSLDQIMAGHISRAISRSGGKIEGAGGAASLLGMHPSTLRAKMRKLNIPFGREKNSPAARFR